MQRSKVQFGGPRRPPRMPIRLAERAHGRVGTKNAAGRRRMASDDAAGSGRSRWFGILGNSRPEEKAGGTLETQDADEAEAGEDPVVVTTPDETLVSGAADG